MALKLIPMLKQLCITQESPPAALAFASRRAWERAEHYFWVQVRSLHYLIIDSIYKQTLPTCAHTHTLLL